VSQKLLATSGGVILCIFLLSSLIIMQTFIALYYISWAYAEIPKIWARCVSAPLEVPGLRSSV